jgi:hypothetical protein
MCIERCVIDGVLGALRLVKGLAASGTVNVRSFKISSKRLPLCVMDVLSVLEVAESGLLPNKEEEMSPELLDKLIDGKTGGEVKLRSRPSSIS